MTSPAVIGWLHRALRHEFGAARQFALQSVVLRRLGRAELAGAWDEAAAGELAHAQRLAGELVQLGAALSDGSPLSLPVGGSVEEMLRHALRTEAQAVALYRDAARTCPQGARARALFVELGAEEAEHLAGLQRLAAG